MKVGVPLISHTHTERKNHHRAGTLMVRRTVGHGLITMATIERGVAAKEAARMLNIKRENIITRTMKSLDTTIKIINLLQYLINDTHTHTAI